MIKKCKNNNCEKGFTLAEALITLVVIGIIAALTIPGILVNTEQHEYKSAFKKALSSLNQVIELSIALDGSGPIDAGDMTAPDAEDSLFEMFRNRMNVISISKEYDWGGTSNYAFYTGDGMRFEFPTTPKVNGGTFATNNGNCATPGIIAQNDEGTEFSDPCLIIVDVNGDRKPNPRNTKGAYKVPAATARSKVLDVFPIIVTDKSAYPFGVVAQRAMFQHD